MKEIILNNGMTCLLDDEDYEKFKHLKFHAKPRGHTFYAGRSDNILGKNVHYYIHRKIMNCPDGMSIDHIDGNGLNNQKSNLRICTHKQNIMNQKAQNRKNRTSSYKGVSLHQSTRLWRARIGDKVLYAESEKEAALIYNCMASFKYREFARLNKL